jgi:hypothetical protein
LPAAAGGLVAGHFLTYVLVAPSTVHRAALLSTTGHAYFSKAIAAAAAFGAIAMGLSAARGWARRFAERPSFGWRQLTIAMALVQLVGFVVLETVERAVVRTSVGGIGAVLPVGFAVEAMVAAAVAALLCLTAGAAASIARAVAKRRARRPRRAHLPSMPWRRGAARPALDLLSFSIAVRGPPVPSIA